MVLIAVLIAFEKLLPWEVIPSGATAALLVVLDVAATCAKPRVTTTRPSSAADQVSKGGAAA